MKKLIYWENLYFKYLVFILAILLVPCSIPKFTLKDSSAESSEILFTSETPESSIISDNEDNILSYSIFIKDPTYSFVYNNNLYFFDAYDNNLKIFNISENKFYSEYLHCFDQGTLIDATICDDYIFALFLNLEGYASIIQVNLDINNLFYVSLCDTNEELMTLKSNYSKITVLSSNSEFFITLTPKLMDNNSSTCVATNPLVLIEDAQTKSIKHITKIVLNENLNQTIKNSLFKVILCLANSSETYFNLILACNSEIFASNLSVDSLSENTEIDLTDTNFYRPIDTASYNHEIYAGLSLLNVNLLNMNNTNFLAITYSVIELNGTLSSYTKIYSFNLSLFGTGSTFEIKKTISNSLSKYVCASSNGLTYPSNQAILYIMLDATTNDILITNYKISNPNLTINYYQEDEFIYTTTNKNSALLESPWSSSEVISITKNEDLIIIGEGIILSQNLTFKDFKYCLYTNNNRNYLGFIKTEDLSYKEKIPLSSYKYSVCTVFANSPLYSLPTKVLGTTIGKNYTSSLIMNIQEYSRIEIIDTICGYNSNNSIFVKVKVNGNNIGYIDTNQIQNKNDINIFIVCNASIKFNDTNVYLNADDNSDVICQLSSGMRVQINGTRDRKSGLTSVTFCDEYGNVFSGYILSDFVQMDGWSVLQIVGSIFIAVNIGILILIFYFKRKRIDNTIQKNANNIKFE